ncbi:MAG: 50S ribosome-binding GTPase, partial [Propionibacteriaceae bacterium]|nr:50S ribosome-binding GTPase [Propionibacteriaceae bacterium]
MPDFEKGLSSLLVAIDACRGRVDPIALGRAQTLVERIGRRLSLSRDVTVIALAGATGSGKSSLFNALTRTALARPGVQRPMTRQAMAATFGTHETTELLDWLGITNRHILPGGKLDGIVLVDLVDNDSIALGHQEEVDRILEVVDEFFWVVDPQKYADATLHEQYLRRYSGHQSVMTFVLNQMDRLSAREAADIRQDFVKILQEDGIARPVVCQVSALTGHGIAALRRRASQVAKSKQSMVARLRADILMHAKGLRGQLGLGQVGPLTSGQLVNLTQACTDGAGVEQVGDAILASVKQRGAVATGWPLLSWISGLKDDPFKRLRFDRRRAIRALGGGKGADGGDHVTPTRVHPIASARIESAVRALRIEAGANLPAGWQGPLDRVVREQAPTLPDAIDRAMVSCELDLTRSRPWWTVIRVLQWLILLTALGSAGWLLAPLFTSMDLPIWQGFPLPG